MLEADNLTESGKETVQESPVNTTDIAGCHPSITKTEEWLQMLHPAREIDLTEAK